MKAFGHSALGIANTRDKRASEADEGYRMTNDEQARLTRVGIVDRPALGSARP
jgi:hypothetical protein